MPCFTVQKRGATIILTLTDRETNIIKKLLQTNHDIKLKELSAEYQVNIRTIQYDLENVRTFFREEGLVLESRQGKGLRVDASPEKKKELLASFEHSKSRFYHKNSRVQYIIIKLFLSEKALTTTALAEEFSVSRNTIKHDLDEVELLLREHEIILHRKPGIGSWIEGAEPTLRFFMESIFLKSFSNTEIYEITKYLTGTEEQNEGAPYFFGSFRPIYEIASKIYRKMILTVETEKFQRENLISVLVRTLISIDRTLRGHLIGSNAVLESPRKNHYMDTYFKEIAGYFDIPCYIDESDYVDGSFQSKHTDVDISQFASLLIERVGDKMKFPYHKDTTLYARLLSHLTLSFEDPKSNLIDNPFEEMILKNHAGLYEYVKLLCLEYLDDMPLIIGTSFTSYLVLHFLTSERNLTMTPKFRALFVCSTGRGAARLIEQILETEIPDLEILAHCSLLEVYDLVKREKPDYIISVFPLEITEIPVFVVNTIPTKENIELIKQALATDSKEKNIELSESLLTLPRKKNETAADLARQVVVDGITIYQAFLEADTFTVREELSFAFLTHVMLLAHRINFDEQYSVQVEALDKKQKSVAKLFSHLGLHVKEGEIQAILNYLN